MHLQLRCYNFISDVFQMYLAINESLQLGQNYTLSFEFNYTLREALEGFYLSHYTTSNGSKR